MANGEIDNVTIGKNKIIGGKIFGRNYFAEQRRRDFSK